MNALSTIGFRLFNILAADAPKPLKEDVTPSTPFFGPDGYIGYLQLVLIFVMIGLIIFYFMYKKKQQNG
jgi:hypothetical protein